jgi:hypothetical protein
MSFSVRNAQLIGGTPKVILDLDLIAIKSSQIAVAGTDFPVWFNKEIFGKATPFDEPGQPLFPGRMGVAPFHTVWDNLSALTGKEAVCLNEFVAHLLIMYNETGGGLRSMSEVGDDAYFFEPRVLRKHDQKASYNGPANGNRPAGDQLATSKVISSPADVTAWNSRVKYPADQAANVKLAARQCDFYKFRGHGLNQLTFRGNFQSYADGALQTFYGKKSDDMTTEELDQAFLDPRIYLTAFRLFHRHAAGSLEAAIGGDFAKYGNAVAGGKKYGPTIFKPRCETVRDGMRKAGYTAH